MRSYKCFTPLETIGQFDRRKVSLTGFTADDAEKLLVRPKEIYDGAIPSGNSIAALDLIRLSRLTMVKEFESKAELLFKTFSSEISQIPNAYPQMLIALDFALGPSKEIVIAGEKDAKETSQMINGIYKRFISNKVVAFRPPSGKEAEAAVGLIPFLKADAIRGKDNRLCLYKLCLCAPHNKRKEDAGTFGGLNE